MKTVNLNGFPTQFVAELARIIQFAGTLVQGVSGICCNATAAIKTDVSYQLR
jgi:hypothetical protein